MEERVIEHLASDADDSKYEPIGFVAPEHHLPWPGRIQIKPESVANYIS